MVLSHPIFIHKSHTFVLTAQNQREDFHVHEYILDQQASAVWYVLKMCNEYWMTNLFLRMSLREAATVQQLAQTIDFVIHSASAGSTR